MMENMKRGCAVLCFLTLLEPVSVPAASFSTSSSADAFVTTGPSGELANNNYGAAGALAVAAPMLAKGEFQSVLQFNLQDAVASFNAEFGVGQWSVQSVTLQLSSALANNAIFNTPAQGSLGISWMQNDTWQEGTGSPAVPSTAGITFNALNRGVIDSSDENLGTFNFDGAQSGIVSYSLKLSPGFLSDVTSGSNVSLRLFANDDSVSGVFNSRNFGTAGNRPALIVTGVPEPTTEALAAVAVLCTYAWRRWPKRAH